MWTFLTLFIGVVAIIMGGIKIEEKRERLGIALFLFGGPLVALALTLDPVGTVRGWFIEEKPVTAIPARVAPPRGEVCEARPGWTCVELQPEQTHVFSTPEGVCYEDDFRQGISVKGRVTSDAGEKLWAWRENGVAYEAIMAENWASVPRAYYYRVTQKPATGCVVN